MDAAAVLLALRWIVADTFRQAIASRVFWLLFGAALVCTLFCFSVSIESDGIARDGVELYTADNQPLAGPNPNPGRMTLLFGAFTVFMHRDARAEVQMILNIFTTWLAGGLGVLLTLVFTAGFVPESLRPDAAAVILSKPTPRWVFLTGKYLGVVLFVASQATLFFVGTWLGLGLRTGIWINAYLVGLPLFLIHFAAFYSFSVLLAATFRGTTACILGSILFWSMCGAVNYGRHAVQSYEVIAPESRPLPAATAALAETAYWILPKPIDLVVIVEEAMNARADRVAWLDSAAIRHVIEQGLFQPFAILLASLAFIAVALALAAHQLASVDY